MRLLLVVLIAAALLQGCGLRGPLYLPTPQQEREMAERQRRLEERERGVAPGNATEATPEAEEPVERSLPSDYDRTRGPQPITPQLPPVQ